MKVKRFSLRKYFEITKFALQNQMIFKVNYIHSLIGFAIHFMVFSFLWIFILQDKTIVYNKQQMIWYVIMGELVIYSIPNAYKKVSDMVKQGDIVNLLIKPVNFVYYMFFEQLSHSVIILVNSVLAIVFGLLMAGPIKLEPMQLVCVVISFIISVITGILLQITVGLFAFFMEENKSIYIIMQKLEVLLILTPLDLFPNVVGSVLRILPTTYVIYAPARILIAYDSYIAVEYILLQCISLAVVCLGITILYQKGVRKIHVNGG